LSGLEGEVAVSVTDGDDNALFDSSISLGTGNGQAPTFTTTGPIRVTVMSLADLGASGALGSETLAALEQIEATGSLMVLAIEQQSHVYQYEVAADVAMTLSAQMSLHLRAPAGGVGVAATLGGPFENLAQFVADGLDGVNGLGVQRAINAAAGLTAAQTSHAPASPCLCGVFGSEAMLLVPAPILLSRRRRRNQ